MCKQLHVQIFSPAPVPVFSVCYRISSDSFFLFSDIRSTVLFCFSFLPHIRPIPIQGIKSVPFLIQISGLYMKMYAFKCLRLCSCSSLEPKSVLILDFPPADHIRSKLILLTGLLVFELSRFRLNPFK